LNSLSQPEHVDIALKCPGCGTTTFIMIPLHGDKHPIQSKQHGQDRKLLEKTISQDELAKLNPTFALGSKSHHVTQLSEAAKEGMELMKGNIEKAEISHNEFDTSVNAAFDAMIETLKEKREKLLRHSKETLKLESM